MSIAAAAGSFELGIIYAIMALGVFISYRILDVPDLTVDGSFTLGASISAVLSVAGQPVLGLLAAIVAGAAAGMLTAVLNTKLKIQALLSGILTMLALYSVNLRVMGKANIALMNTPTVFAAGIPSYVVAIGILAVCAVFVYWFLNTKAGFALRAAGDNEVMARSVGIHTDSAKLLGLAIANGLTGLSGALIAQYQSFADISMGVGMVIIALASVIIGEAILVKKTLFVRLLAAIVGSVIYRFVIALVLQLGLNPVDLKLISAVIVVAALSMPVLGRRFKRRKGKGE
jgi:putative ABC transport system permease protein